MVLHYGLERLSKIFCSSMESVLSGAENLSSASHMQRTNIFCLDGSIAQQLELEEEERSTEGAG